MAVAELFAGSVLAADVVANASALKMVVRRVVEGHRPPCCSRSSEVARHFDVEEDWRLAAPEVVEGLPRAEHAAATKGWRWVGEMEEIADTFAAAGEPDGFHRAAAEVYRS